MSVPLVIVDYRVLCHFIRGMVEQYPWVPSVDLARHGFSYLLNSAPNLFPLFEAQIVIMDDFKTEYHPYWRKVLYPEYKGNRAPKTGLDDIVAIGNEYIHSPKCPFPYFSSLGNEADDFAGAFCKFKHLHQDPRQIYLYTVDSDWLQLVDEGITWVDLGPYLPGVRGKVEAIEWTKKRLKRDIQHPREIVDVKMSQGDKSDNLPKGSPRYMIDLMGMPAKYDPYCFAHLSIKQVFENPVSNRNLKHFQVSKTWFRNQGINPRPFTVENEPK